MSKAIRENYCLCLLLKTKHYAVNAGGCEMGPGNRFLALLTEITISIGRYFVFEGLGLL